MEGQSGLRDSGIAVQPSVFFWAYDFSERMTLCAYDLCAYHLSVRLIFMTMLLFL